MSYIVVGLGNPGKKYEGTRHNAGFRVVEKLAGKHRYPEPGENKNYLYSEGKIESERVILVQPLTFMNLSGEAVIRALKKFNLDPGRLIVVYDDMDLDPGAVKIKPGGGSGGHRGINSIISSLSNYDFIRVRVGIGKAPPWLEGSRHVLGKPEGEEKEALEESEEAAVKVVEDIVALGVNEAMNRWNRKFQSD